MKRIKTEESIAADNVNTFEVVLGGLGGFLDASVAEVWRRHLQASDTGTVFGWIFIPIKTASPMLFETNPKRRNWKNETACFAQPPKV